MGSIAGRTPLTRAGRSLPAYFDPRAYDAVDNCGASWLIRATATVDGEGPGRRGRLSILRPDDQRVTFLLINVS
jgi:hypothetical protein